MNGAGLFGSAILEVAIGLFFVYLVLSMICSSVNELLASLLKWRAENLENGIKNLICDPDIFDKVMDHPLIKALGTNRTETSMVQRWAPSTRAGRPSYIPSRVFSTAFLDALTSNVGAQISVTALRARAETLAADGDQQKQQVGRAVAALIGETRDPSRMAKHLDDLRTMVSQLPEPPDPAEQRKLAMLAAMLSPARELDEAERVVMSVLPVQSEARSLLLSAIRSIRARQSDVECDLQTLHTNICKWFDDTMERVSGVYKRKTQMWLVGIAAVVCLLFGADSLRIVTTLSVNASMRAAIVDDALRQTGLAGTPTPAAIGTPTPSVAPGAGITTPPPTGDQPQPVAVTPTPLPTTPTPSFGALVTELSPYSALFGYSDRPDFLKWTFADNQWSGELDFWQAVGWLKWGFFKLLGILATVCAVSQGAPFWFDLLGKVANLRAAGQPPATAAQAKQEQAAAAPA